MSFHLTTVFESFKYNKLPVLTQDHKAVMWKMENVKGLFFDAGGELCSIGKI
jgi:hypothetical protein